MAIKEAQNGKKQGIVVEVPKALSDLRESRHKKFILKFSTKTCPPCKRMKEWLESSFQPEGTVPIYEIHADEDNDVSSCLCTMYNVTAVPQLVVTDRTLSSIDISKGFDPHKTAEFINKHFPAE